MNRRVAFVLFTIGVSAVFLGVLAHEAVHLLLANEAHGVCIGYCNQGTAIASAYGEHNELSSSETLPTIVGYATAVGFTSFGLWILRR